MYLRYLFKNLDKKLSKIKTSGISFDSSKVKKNNIFFAIKGEKFDGNEFIGDAIKKGAKVIISEKDINIKNSNVIFFKTKNARKLLAELSFMDLKNKPKSIIAVTGTNGKSSVSDFYFQILSMKNKKVASVGTIGVRTKNKLKEISNTTLDPIELKNIINQLTQKNINHIILEASSHGLKQNRLDGLFFDIGIFTNLSHDHLDYHKNFKDYLDSKLYLFKNLIKNKGTIILDSTVNQFKNINTISKQKKIKMLSVFGKNSDLELFSHRFDDEFQIIKIKYKKQIFSAKVQLIGKVQIQNILMASLAAIKTTLNPQEVFKTLNKIKSVEGRFEKIGKLKNNSKVILDFAHTPEALKTLLLNIKEQFPEKKISLVFGCGGNRDIKKRSKMGKIANNLADSIYLTDDNPRYENPDKIRYEIKKGIKNKNINEIPDRRKAISKCIQNLNTGDIAIIAGKGHEKSQYYKGKKLFFSDRSEIIKFIKIKNKSLNKDIRLNIIRENTYNNISRRLNFKNACINSKEIKKNDIFFAIKGKKNNGNKFALDAKKRGSSLLILNEFNRNIDKLKQIKVRDTLKFLIKCASIYRENIKSNIIGITGSCGKTTLKEMLAYTLNKISKVSYSPKSYNNKYGLPLSLLNHKINNDFGVFEVGMDKKGEIDYLTKILKPNIGVITNISYAHSKNFKNISKIAEAKSEIIDNIKSFGTVILNADDKFYKYHKSKALRRKLKVLSFSLKNQNSSIHLYKVKKINKKFQIFIRYNNLILIFNSRSDSVNFIQNLICTLLVLSIFFDIKLLSKNIFFDFKIPEGRGDISKIKVNKKIINLVDESYNSNPLSLKAALLNYDKLNVKKAKKHLLIGDMLELGKHSVKHHLLFKSLLNNLKVNKIHVIGKYIKKAVEGVNQNKKGKILKKNLEIIDLIKNDLSNNDYLLIKGSNATGLNMITKKLKKGVLNVL